ncbi:MAG: prepilin peptidase [Pseudomonadota bacterium]
MVLFVILIFCALIALGFGGAAAWSDYTRMTIPNLYALSILLAFVPAYGLIYYLAPEFLYFSTWQSHLGALALVFAVTYVLFLLKVIGGGDAKLLSAYALWVGMEGLMPLVFFMAAVGGVLGIITLMLGKYKPVKKPRSSSWVGKAQREEKVVPYGIAIFVGAIIAFWQVGYLQPEILISLATTTIG